MLSKRKRVKNKQIKANKLAHDAMNDDQKEPHFAKVQKVVASNYAKKGLNF